MKHYIPKNIPFIPVKEIVVFPQVILSIYISEEESKRSLEVALSSDRLIFLSNTNSHPKHSEIGCIAFIMKTKKLENGSIKVLIQGFHRAKMLKQIKKGDYVLANLDIYLEETEQENVSEDQKQKIIELKNILKQLNQSKSYFGSDFLLIINNMQNASQICDLIASNLNLKSNELQKVLETFDIDKRLGLIKKLLLNELDISQLQGRIQNLIQKQLPKSNDSPESFFKNYSMPDGKKEELKDYTEKIKGKNLSEEAKKEIYLQLSRLEKMHSESSEASMLRNYLDCLIELPWSEKTEDNLDLMNAEKILNEDHYELRKIKERILEFLAVRSLNPKNLKGPILCFTGPPGVGKTSLGKSIAKAMGRKYFRISLGGINDEAEIRGHRRTYVGAMPGKMIQALSNCKTKNPVIVLDEIDKLSSNFKGDPASALLEALDPEQNSVFRDHYLNIKFDLSQVFFIATANLVQNIPPALRDRLEIIHISGYTQFEKIEIAKKYILEKELSNSGLPKNHIQFNDTGLKILIDAYTQEAGLRNLQREISSICRKVARNFVSGDKNKVEIKNNNISDFLGAFRFFPEANLQNQKPGIATGLAWTEAGGKILYVESISISNKKGNLILTGQLGDVMKESAQAALSYVKSFSESLGIDVKWFDENEIHIHLPAGAIPKDGPSAGITLASAILSLITKIPIKGNIAMTGEISLSGRVLPVGGIKEKILAAFNENIKTIILPAQNKGDLENIPKEIKEKLNFIFVENLDQVFKTCFSKTNSIKKERKKRQLLIENKILKNFDVA